MALLEVRNLQTHFRTPEGINRAVDGVSFDVDEGETLAIVGESGCGKSVTSMSLMRLIPEPPGRIAGSVRFQGRICCNSPSARCAPSAATTFR
jgi:peptide/nickel transport system ATP-binding protein